MAVGVQEEGRSICTGLREYVRKALKGSGGFYGEWRRECTD